MIGRMLRRHPTTLVLVALTLGTALIGLRGQSSGLRFALGTGYEQVIDLHR